MDVVVVVVVVVVPNVLKLVSVGSADGGGFARYRKCP